MLKKQLDTVSNNNSFSATFHKTRINIYNYKFFDSFVKKNSNWKIIYIFNFMFNNDPEN